MSLFRNLIVLLLFLGQVENLRAIEANQFCGKFLETLPIQQQGRVKPLYVHSKELIHYLGGKKYPGKTALEIYCHLSLQSIGLTNDIDLKARVDHIELKKFLGFKPEQKRISYKELVDEKRNIRIEAVKIKEETSYKKALTKLFGKISAYENIISGNNWFLPVVKDNDPENFEWLTLPNFLAKVKGQQDSKEIKDSFEVIFKQTQESYFAKKGKTVLLEVKYAKAHLVGWSMVITLLALFFLGIFKNQKIGLVFTALSLVTQTVFITMRIFISGRAPITNMYETVLFSGYGALIIALIISYTRKDKIYVFVGLAYQLMTLMMMIFAHGMLDPKIGPLVPVLRDNFWLSTHVTTVILSYAAFALSWILANIVAFKRRFSPDFTKKELSYQSDLIYSSLKYGTIFLSAGLILGGVWADYSWGRFWGWDPKETWSLIVLLIYMAILHGRHTNWIQDHLFIPFVALAFLSVMMAWFGVNYILASGLHSYGFSEGGAIFLGSFFAIQFIFLGITEFTGRRNLVA